jgi:hypothetical protein
MKYQIGICGKCSIQADGFIDIPNPMQCEKEKDEIMAKLKAWSLGHPYDAHPDDAMKVLYGLIVTLERKIARLEWAADEC